MLNTLMLSGNGLEGTLPETWGSNLNNVTTLDLSQNVLSGTLPAGELNSLPLLELHLAQQISWSMGMHGMVKSVISVCSGCLKTVCHQCSAPVPSYCPEAWAICMGS